MHNATAYQKLTGIVRSVTTDPNMRDDLLQEALYSFHVNRAKFPQETMSWHLQRCRMKLLDYLGQGRSVDSLKRQSGACPIPDPSKEDAQIHPALVQPESISEFVSARDVMEQLQSRLCPMGRQILKHLCEGYTLREIGFLIGLTPSRVWEYRKEIAATAMLIGFAPV
jgi:RNA polymerase sigma factor (sigma-70 family)